MTSNVLNNLSIKTKLYSGFGLLIAICLGLALFGLVQFGAIKSTTHVMQVQAGNAIRSAEVVDYLEKMRRSLLRYAYDHDAPSLKENGEVAAKAIAALQVSERTAIREDQRNTFKSLQGEVAIAQQKSALLVDVVKRAEAENATAFKKGNTLVAASEKLDDSLKGAEPSFLALAHEIDSALQKMRIASWRTLALLDPNGLTAVKAAAGKVLAAIAALEKAELSPDARADIASFKTAFGEYATIGSTAIESTLKIKDIYIKDVAPQIVKMQETMAVSQARSTQGFQNSGVSVDETIASSELAQQVIAAFSVFLGLAMAWIIGRAIANPIVTLVGQIKKLADGDFNSVLPDFRRNDEIGQMAAAVAEMTRRVRAIISNIKVSANEVTNASAEISTSTTDLSQRTEEQAASLEQTSASMEEMTATVKKNAENAREASNLAANTQDVADRGGQVVAKTVEAMAKIEDSSRKISDIIGVIDEIARQTNLLALNAAVEAARAGEAGRGFAVVATEVRSLAQRSSQAAKDIKELITNSNGQVKDGVDLVNKAGQSLTEIVESIKRVTAVIGEIANASAEQSTGLEEINKALNQMDEVTQQNSALVEENAATAKTLEGQAKSMDDQVAFFQIAEGAGHGEEAQEFSEQRPVAAAPSRGPAAKLKNRAA